ncbi:hypothetical protein HYV49_04595 [Candidatus Pacearchaeota archaeon]|nr:hypothetical protein [Candidatus Pacearchaeota archaeon]
MRGVFVIMDGIGDLPCKALSNKTPLEAASTPYLDQLASGSEIGAHIPINEKFAPESHHAIVALFGEDYRKISRGIIEALGAGVSIKRGDLVLRANFATITDLDEKDIVDRRVNRSLTTKEAKLLAKSLNSQVKLTCDFEFIPTIQHRGLIVFRGAFSDNISDTDPAYPRNNKSADYERLRLSEPLDDDENSALSAHLVNSFTRQSFEILNKHPINNYRRKNGLLPANVILTRGAGSNLPDIRKWSNWGIVAYMPLEIGIGKIFGMKIYSFEYPDSKTPNAYDTLLKTLKKASKFAAKSVRKRRRDNDYLLVHFKETDIPGHDGNPQRKKEMMEIIDKYFFSYLTKLLKKERFKILVTGDHATPSEMKNHSADAVPFLFFDPKNTKNSLSEMRFCERDAAKGRKLYGKNLLKETLLKD